MSKITRYRLRADVSSAFRKHLWRPTQRNQNKTHPAQPTGTLQKMIVENGSVTLNLDLNGLNGSDDLTRDLSRCSSLPRRIRFFPFSFSTISCAAPSRARSRWFRKTRPIPLLPAVLATSLKQLVVEKLPPGRGVRHGCARRKNRLHVSSKSKDINTITMPRRNR